MASESLTEKALKLLTEKSAKARAMAKKAILEEKTGIKKVDEAVEQYLSRWDDTTRPGILSLACEAAGGNPEDAVPLQAALLFIDATMDIHDDIIDESVAKKNRKTLYGKLGKEATLLLGDAFMVKGFNHLHKAIEHLPKDRSLQIIDEVNHFLSEVVEAHISEASLKEKKWRVKPETYLQVLTKKASDLEGRMKIGVIYGGGSAGNVQALGKFGRNIGVLLAVKSDFVDIFEPSELMHRIKYEVLPLQVLYALQNHKHGTRIREILQKARLSKVDCDELIETICATKEFISLNQLLDNLEKEAIQALNVLSNSQIKKELQLLAASLTEDL
ncbi:MAG TPA: polyprenyl synthetase family protein [Candidatus Bathyarchaeia archaeon]|nr:polyprenyl synthetase family protein [Candidatus Bathyarchaeia archaeon]